MKFKVAFNFMLLLILLVEARAEQALANEIRNVLFIVADDLRANVLGCYGGKICNTPNIDRLARRGMLFERAYCQGTWCAPSRVSFMHSRYQGKRNVSLGRHFINNGFYSARVGKIFHMRVPGDIIAGTDGDDVSDCWSERFNSQGLEAHTPGDYACLNMNIFNDALEGRESTGMKHRAFVTVQYDGDGSDQPDFKTASQTIELLRQRREKPFFIACGFIRPHYPMVAPRQYFKPYSVGKIELPPQVEGDIDDIPKIGRTTTSQSTGIDRFPINQKRMWQGYYASVQFMDEQVGQVLDELERLGHADSTMVVFTSDHGYQLGDHTFWQKLTLHEQVARVPLIVSVPGCKPGRTKSFAELVDVYPTITSAVGVKVPDRVQGVSLMPVVNDASVSVKDEAVSIHKGALLRTDQWAYMKYRDGSEELYDMVQDTDQIENLIDSEKHQQVLVGLRKSWKAKIVRFGINIQANKKR